MLGTINNNIYVSAKNVYSYNNNKRNDLKEQELNR